jgi:hypothetical protein
MVTMPGLTRKLASSKSKMPETCMGTETVITRITEMEGEGETHQVQIPAIVEAHNTSPMEKEGGEKITVILNGPLSP